jgi:Zn-finger nucleic acid-binding protein
VRCLWFQACTLEKLAEKERRAEEVRAKKASRVEGDGQEEETEKKEEEEAEKKEKEEA